MNTRSKWYLLAGPFLGFLFYHILVLSVGYEAASTAGITLWVAIWWVTEPIPIPATSIIPFFAFPMSGVISNKQIAQAYGHWLILLLMSGFILSAAMEKSGVHKRIAHKIIHILGSDNPKRIILGVMISTGCLSAWISNTATCLMMLPIVLALCQKWEEADKKSILLALAYSASIGGIATPIGTPPNIILMGVYEETTKQTIGFMDWMFIGVPISVGLLFFAWLYLTKSISTDIKDKEKSTSSLPHMSLYEKRILLVFVLTALAWMTRAQPFGGWSALFQLNTIGDDTIGLMAVVSLFLIPSGNSNNALLTWEDAQKIPWGLLLLFGGGIAIAKAFGASGLSDIIGELLTVLSHLPLLFMMVSICFVVTFLTEITSNTATTTLLMPILAATAISIQIDPLFLMVPAAISASCAFMLPVATAPNAIVFGTNQMTTVDMAKTGFAINIIGIIIITGFSYLLLT